MVKPETTVTTFLDAFKNKKVIDYASLFDGDVSSMTGDPFSSETTPTEISTKMMEMILSYEYEVKDTVIDKDGLSATVTLEFTTVNLGLVFTNFTTQYLAKALQLAFSGGTAEQMNQASIDVFMAVSNGAPKDKVTTVEVKLVKVEKAWLMKSGTENIALFDGMMGGLISMTKALNSNPQ